MCLNCYLFCELLRSWMFVFGYLLSYLRSIRCEYLIPAEYSTDQCVHEVSCPCEQLCSNYDIVNMFFVILCPLVKCCPVTVSSMDFRYSRPLQYCPMLNLTLLSQRSCSNSMTCQTIGYCGQLYRSMVSLRNKSK